VVATASVSELVELAFLVTDVDGLTPFTGILDASFGKVLLKDSIASALPITVTETTVAGRYVASFTPDAAGRWYIEVLDTFETFYACYVEVGGPPTDWVDAIVAGVWSEFLPGTFPVGAAGYQLGNLYRAVIAANIIGAQPGSTRGVLLTNAVAADDFYNGLQIIVCSDEGSVARRIVDYAMTDGTITLNEDLPFDMDDGDQVIILGRLGEVAIAGNTTFAIKLCEIHKILGLDAEAPLCVSKKSQIAGDIKLTQTEVGNKIVVQREP